jgi:hypothetical protein
VEISGSFEAVSLVERDRAASPCPTLVHIVPTPRFRKYSTIRLSIAVPKPRRW